MDLPAYSLGLSIWVSVCCFESKIDLQNISLF